MSPVKTSRNGVRYYNFKFQTKDDVIDSVGYSKDLKSTIDDAVASKSPVKLKNYKRKANYRDNTKQDIELGYKAKVQLLERIDFESKSPTSKSSASKVNVSDIFTKGYDHQVVTVVGYIFVNGCHPTTFKNTKKKEVYFNDKTKCIPLTLWGDHIDVTSNGNYIIQNITVREHHEEKTLSTTQETKFVPTKQETAHIQAPFELFQGLQFPIRDATVTSKKLVCYRCDNEIGFVPDKEEIKCTSCKRFIRTCELKASRIMHLSFKNQLEDVTMYQPQIEEYFSKNNLPYHNHTDDELIWRAVAEKIIQKRDVE